MVGSSSDCIPLIISGAPRSGKSLLYTLIEGHSEVSWLIDEGLLFEYLYQIRALGPAGAEILLASARRGLDDFILGIRDKQVMPPVEKWSAHGVPEMQPRKRHRCQLLPWMRDGLGEGLPELRQGASH